MLYAMVPASLLIINMILNGESLKRYGFIEKKSDATNSVPVRYNLFLLAASFYFIVDMTWGILYEHHDIPALFPIIYYLTVFYFMFMLLTMLAWVRYIVAFLDKGGRRSAVLLYGVWVLFVIGLICLIANRYHHFMFSYNDAHEYVGECGRNVSFFMQIALYAVVSGYMMCVAAKSTGRQKFRYKAVAATSMVLGVFLVFQILFALLPSYAIGLMLGICMVHSFVLSGEKKEKEIHDHIASVMAEDYEAIFYIEIDSGEYLSFAKSSKYMTLDATELGKDFYAEVMESIDKCVYPEDREYAKSFYNKETMFKNTEGRHSFSFKYRVMINGEPRFFLFTMMRDGNSQYIIFYEKDIEDELNAEKAQKENQKKTVTFGQIAESLASNYDVIYYVDVADSYYIGYEVNNIYGKLEIEKEGYDFFGDSIENIPLIVHKQDRDKVLEFLNKDNMISRLENRKDYSIDYRILDDGKSRFTRMSVRKSSDGTHFIIGVEDIDAEVKRERQQLRELKTEKELARRDELTGIKNKTAYRELEESAQGNIDNGIDYLTFALVVCDTNNLKQINDTQGHAAGDEYIKASARLLCDIFVHSPVFRVGGDEFVVFLRGNDYATRYELMEKLRNQVLENKRVGAGVILSAGMSEYKPESDAFVSDVFERADKEMYKDKERLKS
ncbi:diguanylate cyclase (GGDEF) domain-containing protein [Lachnospiraceae bacterium YSD2013]|nr:diguanylate cyclase (GGDEF) domain-containing protein [Lachnospiraceae bacterium YSD2013]